jgi:hypothetical protein
MPAERQWVVPAQELEMRLQQSIWPEDLPRVRLVSAASPDLFQG